MRFNDIFCNKETQTCSGNPFAVLAPIESFKNIGSFTDIWELPALYFMSFARDDVRATLRTLLDIGDDLPKWADEIEFAKALLAEAPFLQRGQSYIVYARYSTYYGYVGDAVVPLKTFKGVDVVLAHSLYHGAGQVKVGEVEL